MRALFERFRPARWAAAVLAAAMVLGLAQAAIAGGADIDLGLRGLLFGADPEPAPVATAVPAAPTRHRHARRIWAASRSRPLRVAVGRAKHRTAVVAASPRRKPAVRTARAPAAAAAPQKFAIAAKPVPPAIVSIYEDKTLRGGDAVMMGDGIHVFRATGVWPHRSLDFVRLPMATTLAWHLRQTLTDLDHNPPARWAMDTSSG